jgi:predicted nucleic acid-binding protein
LEGEERKIVINASVAVKWFVEEEYTREALLLRDAYREGLVELMAPSLLPYEVLNALKYSGAFGEDELKEVAAVLDALQISFYDLEGDYAAKAIEIAMRKGLTIYDAFYAALAIVEGGILYTADDKMLKKLTGLGVAKHIKDFKLP